MSETASIALDRPRRFAWLLRPLARLGRGTRQIVHLTLMVAALGFGVAHTALRPNSWRRTVRAEFRRSLRQAVGGGLPATLVTASLIGLAIVYQALYWLSAAGQEGLVGTVLVTVLVRSVAPLLVGLILLGRSGMAAVAEIGALQSGGQVRALEAQGLDPFLVLLLPRACAFALASFTLGVMFVVVAVLSGFATGQMLGALTISLSSLLERVVTAMTAADFAVFPVKTLLIGLLVALTACLTAFEAGPRENAVLIPRGFVRGVLAILLASSALGLVV